MHRLPLLLLVVAVSLGVGCSQAPPNPPAPAPERPPLVAVPHHGHADALIAEAAAALEAEQWAEAARLFASAYERTAEAQRGEVAFYWGLALYRQGEAIAKANSRGEAEPAGRARQYFEEARAVLQRAEHPMRDRVLRAIAQFLSIEPAEGRA